MKHEGHLTVYYSLWAKIFLIFSVPAFTFLGLWMMIRPFWEENMNVMASGVSIFIGLAVLYRCVLGVQALRYLNMHFYILEEGLVVHSDSAIRMIPWRSIGQIKEYSFPMMTKLSTFDGSTVIYAFNGMKNFSAVVYVIKEQRGQA